jgi:predicted metal-dependent RNase
MKPAARTLKKVILVHGEFDQQQGLARAIDDTYGIEVMIPTRGEILTL